MKDYAPEKIRNVAIVGHGSCGKTSLASAFLFDAGATTRLTKVENGNTVTDYDPDEIERQISINSAVCHLEWKGHKINVVDCPGYMNFLWDTRASLRAVDAGVVIVCVIIGMLYLRRARRRKRPHRMRSNCYGPKVLPGPRVINQATSRS